MNTAHIKRIAENGGTYGTNGLSSQAKQAVDCAVAAGKKQSGRI